MSKTNTKAKAKTKAKATPAKSLKSKAKLVKSVSSAKKAKPASAKSTPKKAATAKSVKAKTAPKKAATASKTPAKKPLVKTSAKKVTSVKKPTAVKSAAKKKTTTKATSPAPKKSTMAVAAARKATTVAAQAKKSVAPSAPQQQSAPVVAPVIEAPVKPEKLDFTTGDFVVYPAHGVGQVEGVETTKIGGLDVTLYTITFEKDRMRLKLPVSKVKTSGLRKLSSKDRLKDALATLQGRSQVRRIMWSRRAQEYEAKINSGDPVSIAEVLRDLRRADTQGEQSYSERQIYQAALERLAREVAVIEKIDEKKAAEKLEAVLSNVA